MSMRQIGDSIVRWWPIAIAICGGIAFCSVAYARLQGVEIKQANLESRQQRIEWYLVKIGTKMGIDFGTP